MNKVIKEKVSEKSKEGWQAEKHYSQRVYHYIVDAFSLCKRLGFYTGELMPHTGKKGQEDCSDCFRRAEKRIRERTQE